MKKKSRIILAISLLVVSLVSYMAFADGSSGKEKSPLNFTLFATENIFIAGSDISFKGDIWANKNLVFQASKVILKGNTWSINDIKKNNDYIDSLWLNQYTTLSFEDGGKSNIIENTDSKKMIDLMESIENIATENAKVYNGNAVITTDILNKNSIITTNEGEVTGSLNELNNYIIADGKIDIKVSNAKGGQLDIGEREDLNNKKSIVIASKMETETPTSLEQYANGEYSIKIDSGKGVAIVGSIYAPNGNVYISAGSIYIIGNIIAKNIYLRTSYLYGNDEGKIVFKEDL